MKRSVSMTILGAVVAAVLAPITLSAASVPGVSYPPGPCKSFTRVSLDRLMGVATSATPKEQATIAYKGKPGQTDTCTATFGAHQVTVKTSFESGGFGGPFTEYKRPKLGTGGAIEVSREKDLHATYALYLRKNVYFVDFINATLPSKGKRMYAFALAQSKAFAKRK
jgi:hypothetical protein